MQKYKATLKYKGKLKHVYLFSFNFSQYLSLKRRKCFLSLIGFSDRQLRNARHVTYCLLRPSAGPTQTMQNALRWPAASNSTNKAPIPTQLKNLVRKCPQWEEELPPLFKATEIMLNVSRCELCTSSCTKSKPLKPRRAKPETDHS